MQLRRQTYAGVRLAAKRGEPAPGAHRTGPVCVVCRGPIFFAVDDEDWHHREPVLEALPPHPALPQVSPRR